MKKFVPILLATTMVLSLLTGCGSSSNTNTSAASTQNEDSVVPLETADETEASEAQTTSDGPETASADVTGDANKPLVVFFSLAGEQYNVGVIEEGNTAIIAKMIAQETGADLFEIVAETPYPTSHSELLTVAQNEQRENARPAYVGDVENFDQYSAVYIGFPNWWGDMPMIVYNFLESHDFAGKTVIPFVTHGGSGFSNTEKTIADITGATMVKGFSIPGETAQNNRETSANRVHSWLEEEGLLD